MKKLFSAVLIACVVLFASCSYKQRELYSPPSISVHQSGSGVRAGIRQALKSYQWIIEKDTPGVIVARQSRRSHMARVKVTYSKGSVKISYVDSENLKYGVDETGQPRIHSTYNRWIMNLERAIASQVS